MPAMKTVTVAYTVHGTMRIAAPADVPTAQILAAMQDSSNSCDWFVDYTPDEHLCLVVTRSLEAPCERQPDDMTGDHADVGYIQRENAFRHIDGYVDRTAFASPHVYVDDDEEE